MFVKRLFICAIGVGVLLTPSGCAKDQDLPGQDTPVFTANFTIDGDILNISAGTGGYYMFTDYTAATDTTEAIASGRFAYDYCGNDTCANTLTIELYGDETGLDLLPSLDSNMTFTSKVSTSAEIVHTTTLKLQEPDNFVEYDILWNADQAGFIGGLEAAGDSATLPLTGDNFNISLYTNSRVTNLKTVSSMIYYPYEPGLCRPIVLTASYTAPDTVIILEASDLSGSSFNGYELSWYDGISATTEREIPLSQLASFGIVAQNGGCYATAQIINFDPTMGTVSTPAFVAETTASTFMPGGNVAIAWRDQYMRLWRSDLGLQTADSYFRVVSHESYDENEKGQSTRKIRAEAKARLYLDSNPGVWKLLEGQSVFGVSDTP